MPTLDTAQDRMAGKQAQRKSTLAIVLTEPVVFLRPRSVHGRASHASDPGPSSMLRGLLSLTLDKPTLITSISVELTCTTRMTITEGLGARRVDHTPEEHTVYHAVATFFDSSCCTGVSRHSLSAGLPLRAPDQASLSRAASRLGSDIRRRSSTDNPIQHRSSISSQRGSFAWAGDPPAPPYLPLVRDNQFPILPSESPPSYSSFLLARAPSSTSVSSRNSTAGSRRRKASITLSSILETIKLSPASPSKEFKIGTYTYPIAFSIPADSPSTLSRDLGTVVWQLRATARRPGLLVPRLKAEREVCVVLAPRDEEINDLEPVFVERQLDEYFRGVLSIAGRAFVEGHQIPLSLNLMPLEKVTVQRLAIHLDEKTSYLTRMQRIRSETTQRYTLLCLRNPDHAPLLPLGSDSPDLFTTSPIASFFIPSIADDEIRATLLSSFMGPGPWSLEANIQLPGRGSMLTVSNKNRRSNMLVDHTLRVALRVGRAGAPSRAFQDLVLETPVHIFPWVCGPEVISLPQYSESLSGLCVPRICLSEWPFEQTRLPSAQWGRAPRSHLLLPATTRRDDSARYERLFAGQESEIGEAPPAYCDDDLPGRAM